MKNKNNITDLETDRTINSEIELWFEKIDKASLFRVRGVEIGVNSILEAKRENVSLPLIITFCPAIENLLKPNERGQTRRLIALNKDLPRARLAIEELFGLMVSVKVDLKINPHIFLVFADSLEKGAENMFENSQDMNLIANESIKGVQELFLLFDQSHPGLLQKLKLEIPKVRKQSVINRESGRFGTNRDMIIEKRETQMLDPLDPLFNLWQKHLVLTRNDNSFVATGWQNKKGAEALWNRVRFLLAEFIADGELLPNMVKALNPKKFGDHMPKPIFISSSTREGGFEMEADGFNIKSPICTLSPFHNIGRWTEPPQDSPWINELRDL